jgi:hypothetical protein
LPLWSFKDAGAAKRSADEIYGRFLDYRAEGDFDAGDTAVYEVRLSTQVGRR